MSRSDLGAFGRICSANRPVRNLPLAIERQMLNKDGEGNMTRISAENTIFVAGHRGLVGSAVERRLREKGFRKLLTKTREELDLADQGQVRAFFQDQQPDAVVLAAAKVGGIGANSTLPAEFIYSNLVIEVNVHTPGPG